MYQKKQTITDRFFACFIYCQKKIASGLFPFRQSRKTRITIPEEKTSEHDLDTLDLGNHAEVGLLATDSRGLPTTGQRDLTLTKVAGDHTAVIHVEPLMWLNIDFNSTTVLTFDVKLYQVCWSHRQNLPPLHIPNLIFFPSICLYFMIIIS